MKKREEGWEGPREGERAGTAALPGEAPGSWECELNQSAELRGPAEAGCLRKDERTNPFQ